MPSSPASRALVRALLHLLVATSLLASTALSRERAAVGEIRVERLPPAAREVLARIRAGGPFRFERDGVTFGNRERTLPPRPRGYYHEYTVVTPGVRTRGARRIVCGGPRTAPEVCYYTDDHYATFWRIRE
ncbi:MAG: ribonuclease domain-containing protein [Rudaea sp.]